METQQEIRSQLASFGEVLALKGSAITPQREQKQTSSGENMKLSSLPPLVPTDRKPDDIVSEFLDFADRETLIKFLSTYQKTKPDWDNYRHKIPDGLLSKFAKCLQECRKYGFIAPKVEGENIVWKQIFGFKRNYKNTDQCTTCSRSQRAGDCRGRAIYKNHQKMFQPCWG